MVSRFEIRILVLLICAVDYCIGFQSTVGVDTSSLKQRIDTTSLFAQASNDNGSRRAFLRSGALLAPLLTLSSASAILTADSGAANADEGSPADDQMVDVYFGCGCFWHVQHEFVEAERNILGRSDMELTARAAYAGAKAPGTDKSGRVCYHNGANIADYGSLGHAEVVSLSIPTSKFEDFAVEYCKLFKNGMRADQMGDRGPEYRNLVGVPGGTKSPLAQLLVKASQATNDQLDFAKGKGNDADIARLVWIMDSNDFPSYIGEQYHQFHDGFAFGENYPDSYNSLAKQFGKKGENFGSCPNGMMGLGFGGL